MKHIRMHSEAEAELEEGVSHYEERKPGLGLDFQAEVEAALALIEENPAIGARYKRTTIRYFKVKRFPYVVYYDELDEVIWVPAVAHGSRKLGYWRKRKLEE
jgi:toxin ParE1/3/4